MSLPMNCKDVASAASDSCSDCSNNDTLHALTCSSQSTATSCQANSDPLPAEPTVSSSTLEKAHSLELSSQCSSVAERGGVQHAQILADLLLQRGNPQEALVYADRALFEQSDSLDALCSRGMALAALNNKAEAFACYAAILTRAPDHVNTLIACGTLYKSTGLLDEAVQSLRTAYAASSDSKAVLEALASALTDLGTKKKLSGDLSQAMSHYEDAVAVCASYAPAYYNIGVMHSEAQRFSEALLFYEKALDTQPVYPEAYCNIGVIHKNHGRLELAIAAYQKALDVAPNFQIVRNNLAIALTELGTKVKAEGDAAGGMALYERALALNPRYPEALYNMGVVYGELGELQRALFMYDLATHFNPACAEAYNNLGVIHRELGNVERAAQCYGSALQLRPNFPQALNNLAVVYTAQGLARQALHMLQAAIHVLPDYVEAYNNLGVLQRDVGSIPEAIAAYDKCLELEPDSRNAGHNRLLALNYITPGESPAVCEAHATWGQRFQTLFTPISPPSHSGMQDPDRPLVVAYISPDLFTHSVSYFAEAPLAHHSPAAVRTIVYSCVPRPDAKTQRLRAQLEAAGPGGPRGTWVEATHMSEAALAQRVREDRVDILVELTGHTANNRLGTMAMRPAPIQASWIGYPNSTGLAAIDYRFTDETCDPADTQQTYVERLVRLDGCFLCYTPAEDAPPPTLLPALANGFVTFGSFNNLAKITPEVVRVWSLILTALPSSRLLLKNKPFACEAARAHVLALLEAHGVPARRVDLLPLAAANADHLATYGALDISLDPFPYAGTTTTCESLYMGVPCVTLRGRCHAHNVGASLLGAVGLSEGWVAESREQYVRLAVAAAGDLARLGELRAGLRGRMLASRLCDARGFVGGLEATYRRLWHDYLEKCQSS